MSIKARIAVASGCLLVVVLGGAYAVLHRRAEELAARARAEQAEHRSAERHRLERDAHERFQVLRLQQMSPDERAGVLRLDAAVEAYVAEARRRQQLLADSRDAFIPNAPSKIEFFKWGRIVDQGPPAVSFGSDVLVDGASADERIVGRWPIALGQVGFAPWPEDTQILEQGRLFGTIDRIPVVISQLDTSVQQPAESEAGNPWVDPLARQVLSSFYLVSRVEHLQLPDGQSLDCFVLEPITLYRYRYTLPETARTNWRYGAVLGPPVREPLPETG